MSTQILVAAPPPVDSATAYDWGRPRRVEAGRRADTGPEVYCRIRGAQFAAEGYAPCTNLGCNGCKPRD